MSPDPIEHAVAVARLRAWAHGEAAERPTRPELRAWADHVLADRDELFAAYEKAARELAALRREQALGDEGSAGFAREIRVLQSSNRRLRAERDALRAEMAGVTAVIGERDAYRDEANARAQQVATLTEELEEARERAKARGREALDALLAQLRDGEDGDSGLGMTITTTTTRAFIPHDVGGAR